MAKTKQSVPIISKSGAAREFKKSWVQIDYLVKKYHLKPVKPRNNPDHRCVWYNLHEIAALAKMPAAS